MFGGSGGKGMMDDLWLFSNGDWRDVSHVGTKTPPARCLSVRSWSHISPPPSVHLQPLVGSVFSRGSTAGLS